MNVTVECLRALFTSDDPLAPVEAEREANKQIGLELVAEYILRGLR